MESLPEKIGGCRIVAKLGQGGMGAVFRARHETLGREVAVKLLPPAFTQNPEYVQRFLREARAAAQLQHPNVVQIYDAGEQSGQFYITMELVDGTSLAHRLLAEGLLPEHEALGYLVQAARGLAAAHARGLTHRDIKPENLLINHQNVLKIADFGLVTAGSEASALTQDGAMLGTPLYMSPEQGEGQMADARSDLYSLGVTFFRTMTGSTPYNAPTPIGIIYKHKYEPTPDPKLLKPGLSSATSQLLVRLLAKKPEERFQTADEVARTAEALLAQVQTGQVPMQLPAVAPGVIPATGAAPAIPASAYAPTSAPARGQPGVATWMPQVGVATPPVVYAQHPITPPPPGQVYTPVGPPAYSPVGQPAQMYTPVNPPAQMATPVPGYVPTPGMPLQGAYTPAPAPARKTSGALVAAILLVVVALLAGGGFLGYRFYRQEQVAEAKRKAEGLRSGRQYDQAIQLLEAAYVEHPDAGELKLLRDGIEAQSVNERLSRLKDRAQQELGDKSFGAAARTFAEAEKMLANHAHLSGVEADPSLAERRRKAEDLEQFNRFLDEGRAAEKARQFDAAEKAYLEAVRFEVKGGEEASRAATRTRFLGLVAQSEAMEASRNFPVALSLLDQAADLEVGDVTARQERVKKALAYLRLTDEATKAREAGDPRGAAALLDRAVPFAATAEEAEALRAQSRTLTTEAEFASMVMAGESAMKEKRWKEAQIAWTSALGAKPGNENATAQLKRSRSCELADEATVALKQSDYSGAMAKLRAAQNEDPTNDAVKATLSAVERRTAAIQELAETARNAEASGDWNTAQSTWSALLAHDPLNKTIYEQRVNNARYERAMADCKASLASANLQEALRHAKAAQPYDPSGGARALAQIREIEGRIQSLAQAQQKAQITQNAMTQASAMAAQGQFTEACNVLAGALQYDPGNLQLNQMRTGLEAAAAIRSGYGKLEGFRLDAEATLQNAYNADRDRKILAMINEVQGWQGRLAQGKAAPQAAWQAQRYEEMAACAQAMKAQAREMGALFANRASDFSGMAASAAKPKANVGGTIGGLGGIGRRGIGMGSIGASADVGDNQKKAGVFNGTANELARCAAGCRAIAE
jgi:tRNA A-37 threonylcarbamoyl transferase component Bud32